MTSDPSIAFRPLIEADLAMLHEWIHRPHIAQWWDAALPRDLEETRARYLPRLGEESSVKQCIALLDAQPIGFVQSYVAMECGDGWWQDETDPGVRGTDQFLADAAALGRGLGSRMVAAFVARLFEDEAVTRVQTDPDPRNVRAIRCYEKVGFRRVGEVTTPDGLALLMSIDRSRL